MANEAPNINYNIDENLRKQIEETHGVEPEKKPEDPEEIVQKAEDEIKEEPEEEHPEEDESVAEDDEGDEEAEEEQEASEDDDEPQEDDKASSLRRRIESNYKEKLKERDDEMAQLREELKQLQLQQAEQKGYIEATQQQTQAVDNDPEPDPVLDPDEHNAWALRQKDKEIAELRSTQEQHSAQFQVQQARQAITTLEGEYKRMNSDVDYDAIKGFVKDRNATLLKIQNPNASDLEINAAIEQAEMQIFADAYKSGHNGAEAIVKMANELGFEPKNGEPIAKKKPDLKKIKENQRKNASLIGGTDAPVDRSKEVTPEKVLKMSMGQIMKGGDALFKEAYRNLENNAQS